jgi:iron(III) transport system substrate-binding protein
MSTYFRGIVAALAIACLQLLLPSAVAAQQALSINGETIADAELVAAAKKEGMLNHYGTYLPPQMKVIHEAFTADTGIKVEYTRLTSPQLYQRALSEYAANKLVADIIDNTDPLLVADLVDRGILNVPHKVLSYDLIPAELKDPQGRWYTIVRPLSVIAVNTTRLKTIPAHWADLLDPQFANVIGVPNIDAGGAAFSIFSFLVNCIDTNFMSRLAVLKPHVYPAVSPLAADLARGEVAIAIGPLEEPVFAQKVSGAPVDIVLPSEGTAGLPINGGITTTAAHPHAARLFMNWITSKRGGNVVAVEGAYPANPQAGVPSRPGVKYPAPDKVYNLDIETWKQTRDSLSRRWHQEFGVN